MLGQRSPQGEMFRPDHLYLSHVGEDSFHGLLAKMGPKWFRDEDFAALYRNDFGRPSVPPSLLCMALLLQAHDGVSDEEAIERSAYDLRWKVALGLELDEKLCAKSTLQLFRSKLVLNEAYQEVFEKSVEACRQAGLMKHKKLRAAVDTTPVLGRGAVKDTFNLVSDQIRRCVEEMCSLKSWDRDELVERHGLGRHVGKSFKGSVELDWSDAEHRRALVGQLVADARVTLQLCRGALRGYAGDSEKAARLREARDLLADLLTQDVEDAPDDGGGPGIRSGTARDRIISTTDPEMRHGHKSHNKSFDGYKAAVVADTSRGVIVATDVVAANVPDGEGAKELLEEATKRSGQELERIVGDTAYGGSETRAELSSLGAELVVKAPPGKRRGLFSLEDFRIDDKGGVIRCPAGKRSRRRRRVRGRDPGWKYQFSRKDCNGCEMRSQCTQSKRRAREVVVTAKTEKLEKLRREQRTKRFRKRYRERIVVEHRIARLVQLGIRQARYFGRSKVSFQVAMAAAVANLSLAVGSFPVCRLSRCLSCVLAAFFAHTRPALDSGRRSVFDPVRS